MVGGARSPNAAGSVTFPRLCLGLVDPGRHKLVIVRRPSRLRLDRRLLVVLRHHKLIRLQLGRLSSRTASHVVVGGFGVRVGGPAGISIGDFDFDGSSRPLLVLPAKTTPARPPRRRRRSDVRARRSRRGPLLPTPCRAPPLARLPGRSRLPRVDLLPALPRRLRTALVIIPTPAGAVDTPTPALARRDILAPVVVPADARRHLHPVRTPHRRRPLPRIRRPTHPHRIRRQDRVVQHVYQCALLESIPIWRTGRAGCRGCRIFRVCIIMMPHFLRFCVVFLFRRGERV